MKIIISGKQINLTEAIKTYVEEKVSKVLKYDSDIDEIAVQIEVLNTKSEGPIQRVTATAYIIGKSTIRTEEEDKDLYKAIDLMADKLSRHIRKNKERSSR